MADEITMQAYLSIDKGGLELSRDSGSVSVDMTGTHCAAGTQEVGTSAEALEKGDISTPGLLYIHNMDGTNYVEVGYDEGGTFAATVKLLAGEYAVFRLAQTTPQVKANTAAVTIEYILAEA